MYKIRFEGAEELTWDHFTEIAVKHNVGRVNESQILLAHRNTKKTPDVLNKAFEARGWYTFTAPVARDASKKCDDAAKFAQELTPSTTTNPDTKEGDLS